MGRFAGKTAIVTGGGGGIGGAIAETLAADGARVAIVDLRPDSDEAPTHAALGRHADGTAEGTLSQAWGAAATVNSIRAAGGDAKFFPADVSDEAEVAATVSAVREW